MPEQQRRRRIAKTWATVLWAMKSRSRNGSDANSLNGSQVASAVTVTLVLLLIVVATLIILMLQE